MHSFKQEKNFEKISDQDQTTTGLNPPSLCFRLPHDPG